MSTTNKDSEPGFSVWRSLKLGSFHIGSSFADLLTSAVWNRILIADLGVAAWPVALLSALRYFLAPLTLWAGRRVRHHAHPGQPAGRLHLDWPPADAPRAPAPAPVHGRHHAATPARHSAGRWRCCRSWCTGPARSSPAHPSLPSCMTARPITSVGRQWASSS